LSNPEEQSTGAPAFTTRRAALAFGAASGAAVLTGCSVYGQSSGTSAADDPAPTAEETTAAAAGGATGKASPAAKAPAVPALAKTSDIPVGGGKIFAAKKVIVTQPTAGVFKAYSTICTHQGCAINEIKNGTMDCPCHGSKFKIADGSVDAGPAPSPLPAKNIKVDGSSLHLA
jgi:Rieske Fe-S protein